MKNILILLLLSLVSCSDQPQEPPPATSSAPTLEAADSVLIKAEQSTKHLDSITEVTAEKVKHDVKKLNETITNYETKIKAATKTITVEKVIHDTVYIETKKSFWGKTKTSVTTKSDSTIGQSEVIDTTHQ